MSHRKQSGAALVIGLILLLVLTLLAVSGMSAASLEFIMAGNEQYRANAFQAAEAGIEQSVVLSTLNPATPVENLNGVVGTDAWASVVTPPLGAAPQPALWGSSWNSFSTYHFQIASTGTSARGSQAINVQGIAVLAPFDSTVVPDPLLNPILF